MMYQDPFVSYPVSQGIKLLDQQVPGWYREYSGPDIRSIDLTTLDIESLHDCVLAQVFGHYLKGVERLGLTAQEAEQHGFVVGYQSSIGDFKRVTDALTSEWRSVITARRAAGI